MCNRWLVCTFHGQEHCSKPSISRRVMFEGRTTSLSKTEPPTISRGRFPSTHSDLNKNRSSSGNRVLDRRPVTFEAALISCEKTAVHKSRSAPRSLTVKPWKTPFVQLQIQHTPCCGRWYSPCFPVFIPLRKQIAPASQSSSMAKGHTRDPQTKTQTYSSTDIVATMYSLLEFVWKRWAVLVWLDLHLAFDTVYVCSFPASVLWFQLLF